MHTLALGHSYELGSLSIPVDNPDKVLYPAARFTKAAVVAYYVGVSRNEVTVFRGVPESVLGFKRSTILQRTGIAVSGLLPFWRDAKYHPLNPTPAKTKSSMPARSKSVLEIFPLSPCRSAASLTTQEGLVVSAAKLDINGT